MTRGRLENAVSLPPPGAGVPPHPHCSQRARQGVCPAHHPRSLCACVRVRAQPCTDHLLGHGHDDSSQPSA